MALKNELDAFTEVLLDRLGEASEDLFAGQIDQARDHGVAQESLTVGASAPNFSLPGATGESVELGGLLKDGPVVLTFYRGGWCPYCNIQLRAYQRIIPDLEELGARLVAVSPEAPDNAEATQQRESLEFHVLSDLGNKVAKQYGLVYPVSDRVHEIFSGLDINLETHNSDDSGELPVPATYIIDADSTIIFGGADADYRTRFEPEDILSALKRRSAAS